MKEILQNTYNFNEQYYILVFTNNYCNYTCSYCYNKKEKVKYNINFNALIKYITNIKQIIPNKQLIITFIGGEPTLYPQFISLCNTLINTEHIEILTNLSQSLSFFKQLDQRIHITASFHTKHANIDDFVNKCKCLSNIQDIIVMYDPFNINKSIECFNQIINNCNNKNIELNLVDNYKYSNEQLKLFNYHKSHSMLFNIDGQYKQFNEIAVYKRQSFKNWLCYAGINTQYIHCDGKVYFCESYYSENKLPYTSIYSKNIKFINHPIICQCNNCAGNYFIEKRKHFNA